MMAQLIDRRALKQEMKELLRSAQVSARSMTALYLALVLVLNLVSGFTAAVLSGPLATFVSILTELMSSVLSCGFVVYCMAIRRRETAEYLTLFDGFTFVGKIILLNIVIYAFTTLWALLFVIPGIIAAYRYRFAIYNLCGDPSLGIMEALEMSKRQTYGYKSQLFFLDLSYLGWYLLAALPSLVESAYSYAVVLGNPGPFLADPALLYTVTLPISPLLQVLVDSLWPVLVAMCYLPVYQCVDLGYYDAARNTSGVNLRRDPGGSGDSWDSF